MKAARIMLFPLAALGALFEFLIFGFALGIVRVACLVGWHAWAWEEYLRVPFYGLGAWQCDHCGKIRVKP